MDEPDGAVRVSEITELLRAEYAVVTGKMIHYFSLFTFGMLYTQIV